MQGFSLKGVFFKMSENTANTTENTIEAKGSQDPETPSNQVDLDALATIVDNLDKAENNESASIVDEKAQASEDLQTRIDQLESQNAKMLTLIDKMVRMYGARLDSAKDGRGVEPFEPMSVEKTFEETDEFANIPTLEEIKLS